MRKKKPIESFQSSLGAEFTAFIDFKRSLGRKYVTTEDVFRQLDNFLVQHYPEVKELSLTILERWLGGESLRSPSTTAGNLRVIRQFCLYRRRFKPSVFVPDKKNAKSIWPTKIPPFHPHIYSKGEIQRLLVEAKHLPATTNNPHRAKTFFTILLLLYATGMRVSEVAALHMSDVNLAEGTLRIRDTKFYKSRLVPLNQEVLTCLKEYLDSLSFVSALPPEATPMFQKKTDQGYSLGTIMGYLKKILRSSGVRCPGKHGPRIHDLRHTFAVHRLADWYENGADVQNLLPRLATYMGHKDLRSTQYYLTITPEIYERASQRFEQFYRSHQRRS